MVKTFGEPTYALTVPAEKFFPPPKVDSAVLVINIHSKPLISVPSKIYLEMLFSGFKEPRKKFKNILMKKFLKTEKEVFEILEKIGIDQNCRSQNVTIPQWEELTKIFFKEYFERFGEE